MAPTTPANLFIQTLNGQPQAQAWIQGNATNPRLSGLVNFYDTAYGGIIIEAEIFGLPALPGSSPYGTYPSGFYGMHIHEFGNCTPPFELTGGHYNPGNNPHPWHAGDLPPLLNNKGYAWMCVFDTHLSISELIGKSVIIHSQRDDFTSQPSGDSGTKMGCGVIRSV